MRKVFLSRMAAQQGDQPGRAKTARRLAQRWAA